VAAHDLAGTTREEQHVLQKGDLMSDRLKIERLLRELYDSRVRGDLDAVCGAFAHDAAFQIAGAGQVGPILNRSIGIDQFRPLLAVMVKSFKLSDLIILSLMIDGLRAAVHWRVRVYSKLTGATVPTELVDLIEIRNAKVVSYTEFFVPYSPSV
jgi:ketosteroid isomerase-like protein